MLKIGYSLSSEEHAPHELIENAQRAEEAGFEFALISDHFHPWTKQQGQSLFVWRVLGAIAERTDALRIGTGVTCPLLRMHPLIVAHAAATTAALFDGRFFLGLGAGENLNEHVLGDYWPSSKQRLEMMEEAIEIMRELWSGEECSFDGQYYQVDQAQLFTLPERPPEIYLSATGPISATLAGEAADGLVGVSPDKKVIDEFRKKGGRKPAYGQLTVCYARTEAAAHDTAFKWWPQTGLAGDLPWETKTTALIEAACKPLTKEKVIEDMPCGPDPRAFIDAIRKYERAGYDHVYLHQIGPDQAGFFEFYRSELAGELSG
jgi:coenzyme F420-dependent glucose-6-phosphate dehydrogenase